MSLPPRVWVFLIDSIIIGISSLSEIISGRYGIGDLLMILRRLTLTSSLFFSMNPFISYSTSLAEWTMMKVESLIFFGSLNLLLGFFASFSLSLCFFLISLSRLESRLAAGFLQRSSSNLKIPSGSD